MPQVNEFSWMSSGSKLIFTMILMMFFLNFSSLPSVKKGSFWKEFYYFNFLV